MNNILRERPIPGCDSVITPAPLKTFVRQGDELIPVEVDLSEYKRIGHSKDYDYYAKIDNN